MPWSCSKWQQSSIQSQFISISTTWGCSKWHLEQVRCQLLINFTQNFTSKFMSHPFWVSLIFCVTFINLCPSETMTLQLKHHKLLNIKMNIASTDRFFLLFFMWLCCYRGMTLFVKLIGVLLILFIVKHWHFLCIAAKHLLRPRPGWPQAPLLDKRSAIIAHFKDASPSRTAFMHLFWQTPIHSLLFLASSPFHFPPLFCPSSSFPTNPQACLDERLSRETSANRVWFGSRSYWHTEHRNISLFSFSPHLNLAVVDVGKDEGKCGSGVPKQGSFSAGQKGPTAVPSHPHLLQLILK